MKLSKCPRGHFYDASQYTTCPHCEQMEMGMNGGIQEDERFTEAYTEDLAATGSPVIGDGPKTEPVTEPVQDPTPGPSPVKIEESGKTVPFYDNIFGAKVDPVVGWLVCIRGGNFGEGFVLRSGRNFLGRSMSMDVCLNGDDSVSREKHAIVIYEPKGKLFIAQPGESRELFYINDEVVLSNVKLNPYDRLTIGNTELLFVPFCGEKFCWEDLKD